MTVVKGWLALLGLGLLLMGGAQAQEGLSVLSENIDLGSLKPGAAETFTIPVVGGPQPLRVLVEPVSMGTGSEAFLSFDQEVELSPRQRKELPFRLSIPPDALPRAHAVGLRFSSLAPSVTPAPSGQVRVTTAVQLVLRFVVTGIRLDLTVADVEAGQTAQINLIVGNYSSTPLAAQGGVSLTDQKGQAVAYLPLPPTQVPPNKVEAIPLAWPTTPETMGQFIVQAEVEHGEGRLSAQTRFSVGRLKGKVIGLGFPVHRATAGEHLLWGVSLQNEGNLPLPVKVVSQASRVGGRGVFREEKTFQVPPLESADLFFFMPTRRPGLPTSLTKLRDFFLDARYEVRAEVKYGHQSQVLTAFTTLSTPWMLKGVAVGGLGLIIALIVVAFRFIPRVRGKMGAKVP